MPTLISSGTINAQLEAVLLTASILYSRTTYCVLKVVYDYGFRWYEIKDIKDYTITLSGKYQFKTLKNNNYRIYDEVMISPELRYLMDLDGSPTIERSRQTWVVLIQGINNFRKYIIGNKESSLHIFRHNRIKQLYANGSTIEEIKSFTGLKQDSTVMNYVNSEVYQ